MLEMLSDPAAWASFFALVVLEIVLGIDNILFIAVVAGRLPEAQRRQARNIGLSLALGLRIGFLASVVWIVGLTEPVFEVNGFAVSWRDILLFSGGTFLLVKASQEIHDEVTRGHAPREIREGSGAFLRVVGQIALIDVVFSVDSVIVAVGLVEQVEIMIAAVCIAVGVMALLAAPVSKFVIENPTTRMLALAFLLVIGAALVADGFHIHFQREPIYAAMAFAALVEGLNLLRVRRRTRRQANQADQSDLG